jgi:rare lipoprotein A
MRSFLRMLLAAGVFALSLAIFLQEEARAEAMLSSWYGPGLEGNLTALSGLVLLKIPYGCEKKLRAISETTKSNVASIAKKLAHFVRRMAVVDHKPAALFFGAATYSTSAFLCRKHRLTLRRTHATTMFGAVAANLFRVLTCVCPVRFIDARRTPREPSILLGLRTPVELLDRLRFAALRTGLFTRLQIPLFKGLAHSVLVTPYVFFSRIRVSVWHVLILTAVLNISLVFSTPAKADTLLASWYGPGFEGATTASGEVFDPYNDRTAASLYYPMGTKLRVCYAACTVVRVNDLGPYVGGRDLDLSQAAAEEIGLTAVGTDVVDVRVIE